MNEKIISAIKNAVAEAGIEGWAYSVTFQHLTPWAGGLDLVARMGTRFNVHVFLDSNTTEVCRIWVHDMEADTEQGEEYTLVNRDLADLPWA